MWPWSKKLISAFPKLEADLTTAFRMEYGRLLGVFIREEFKGNLKENLTTFAFADAEAIARDHEWIWDDYVPDTPEGANFYVHPWRNQ